jgi:hypothetical protein
MHEIAKSRPAAYLLACCHPDASSMRVWAVPEPIFYEALQNLEFEEDGQKYTVQIFPDRQRLHGWDSSPDLTPYFLQLELAEGELLALKKSREVDALVKRERAISRGASDSDGEDDEFAFESETNALLDSVAQQLDEAGAFDPTEIADGRERVLSSIVRRRGQPAFRQRLLTAYESRCAITGCDVEAVLDAAHIVPYMGPETNHPGNGLLLRTDLHTLFDLKLVAVDAATMTLLVSSLLDNTCYEQYRGSAIRIPNDHDTQPSREALRQHRIESGL